MNWIKEYNALISTGQVVACEEIKSIYARLAAETDRKDGPFYFAENVGQHAIDFMETFCRHYQGEHAGELVRLELFQKAFIQALFGFLERGTDTRRFREYYSSGPPEEKRLRCVLYGLYEDRCSFYSDSGADRIPVPLVLLEISRAVDKPDRKE